MYWRGGDSRLVWVACCLCQHLLNKAAFSKSASALYWIGWKPPGARWETTRVAPEMLLLETFFFRGKWKWKIEMKSWKDTCCHCVRRSHVANASLVTLTTHKSCAIASTTCSCPHFCSWMRPLPMTLEIKPRTQIHFSNTNSMCFSGPVLIYKICTRVPTLFSDVAFFGRTHIK